MSLSNYNLCEKEQEIDEQNGKYKDKEKDGDKKAL